MQDEDYKRCSKCGEEKAAEEFYRDRSQGSGRDSRCKICRNATSQRWREANREKSRAASRNWARNNRKRVAENKRAWHRANPKARAQATERRKAEHPEKPAAITALNRAVAMGWLTRPLSCDNCGKQPEPTVDGRVAIQGHHHDYSKPLDVEWLCPNCHMAQHHKD